MPSRSSARFLLGTALAIVAACMMIPQGWWLIYPFALVGTFIHEAGHALTTVLTGGHVEHFVIRLDTSGYVRSRGGLPLATASAGYLASVAAGGALLVAGTQARHVRTALYTTAGVLLAVTAFFSGVGASLLAFVAFVGGMLWISYLRTTRMAGQRPWTYRLGLLGGLFLMGGAIAYMFATHGLLAWAVGGLMALVLWGIATYASPKWQQGAVIFLGVQLALDGLNSILTLWFATQSGHMHNDAASMAALTGLPAPFWAGVWGLLSLIVVVGALRRYGASRRMAGPL